MRRMQNLCPLLLLGSHYGRGRGAGGGWVLASKSKGQENTLAWLPGMGFWHHCGGSRDVKPKCVSAGKVRLPCGGLRPGAGAPGGWQGAFQKLQAGGRQCRRCGAAKAWFQGCPCGCGTLSHVRCFRIQGCRRRPSGRGLHLHLSKDVKTESPRRKLKGSQSLCRVLSAEHS